VRHIHRLKRPPEHFVHRHAHVLDATAGEHHNCRIGMRGDERGQIVELVQRPGETQQNDAGAGNELGAERKAAERPGQTRRVGVGSQRPFPDEEILMHPDDGGPCIRVT
jgi:hypothetical protein